MRAAWYDRKGPAREVLVVGELDRPAPGPGEVLVRVRASAVNPSDTKGRGGARGNLAMPFARIVPHQDGAGVIEAVGDGVPAGRVGERVWLHEAQLERPFGTAAEYVALPAHRAVPLPDGTSFAEGACLGIPAMTAHRCVFADGPVEGKTILVTGGAGAVGHYAIQFAQPRRRARHRHGRQRETRRGSPGRPAPSCAINRREADIASGGRRIHRQRLRARRRPDRRGRVRRQSRNEPQAAEPERRDRNLCLRHRAGAYPPILAPGQARRDRPLRPCLCDEPSGARGGDRRHQCRPGRGPASGTMSGTGCRSNGSPTRTSWSKPGTAAARSSSSSRLESNCLSPARPRRGMKRRCAIDLPKA